MLGGAFAARQHCDGAVAELADLAGDLRRARRLTRNQAYTKQFQVRALYLTEEVIFLSPEPEQSLVQLVLFHLPHAPTPLSGLDIVCRSQSSSHARSMPSDHLRSYRGEPKWLRNAEEESILAAREKKSAAEMHRYKRGRAKSGRGGKGGKVKSRKQAIAIALSQARKKGKKVPRKKR